MSRATLESALRLHLVRRNVQAPSLRIAVRAMIGRTIVAMRGAA